MFWKLTSIPYKNASYAGLISGGKMKKTREIKYLQSNYLNLLYL